MATWSGSGRALWFGAWAKTTDCRGPCHRRTSGVSRQQPELAVLAHCNLGILEPSMDLRFMQADPTMAYSLSTINLLEHSQLNVQLLKLCWDCPWKLHAGLCFVKLIHKAFFRQYSTTSMSEPPAFEARSSEALDEWWILSFLLTPRWEEENIWAVSSFLHPCMMSYFYVCLVEHSALVLGSTQSRNEISPLVSCSTFFDSLISVRILRCLFLQYFSVHTLFSSAGWHNDKTFWIQNMYVFSKLKGISNGRRLVRKNQMKSSFVFQMNVKQVLKWN